MLSDGSNYEYRFGPRNEWKIIVANTQQLREMAFRLVYDVYTSKRYDLQLGRESGMFYTIHHLHPHTLTFLAEKAGQPVGTVSVIPDSRLGLPTDGIFPGHLALLRKAGRRLCEVSSLAVSEEMADSSIDLTMHLYRIIHLTATHMLYDTDIVASIMAHHAAFYASVLLFDDVSPDSRQSPKTGEQVRFVHLDLEAMKARYAKRYIRMTGKRNLYRWFFQNEEEAAMVEWIGQSRRPMTPEELHYFGEQTSKILSNAGANTVDILLECYRQAADSNV